MAKSTITHPYPYHPFSMRVLKTFYGVLAFLFIHTSSFSQVFKITQSPIVACSGTFTDSGGPNQNYGPNEIYTSTICPDGVSGSHIKLQFAGVDIQVGDVLCFYDGPNTFSKLLACSDDFKKGAPFIIQATTANPTGCITAAWVSNGSNQGKGWSAQISCVPGCQSIISKIVTTIPSIQPVDTGWIDICPGETVIFNGEGYYPQNNSKYHQVDSTSTLEWNFGDGSSGYGNNVSHTYHTPGGYYVQLKIRDTIGCENANYIGQRVRVSPAPSFHNGITLNPICTNDTLELNASLNQISNTAVTNVLENIGSFEVSKFRSDSLALPDGTGVSYSTKLTFSDFPAGTVLTDINQLQSICVNIEHSWLRDLEFSITCPNGTTLLLQHQEATGEEVFLGEPFEDDEVLGIPVPGKGYDYCWSPKATDGTMLEYANNYMPKTLPKGNYESDEPFDKLLGCPLNGDWKITIKDFWQIDNGYIFKWGILFDESLYPEIEKFTPAIIHSNWTNTLGTINAGDLTTKIAPVHAGKAEYTFTVANNFGCVFDTAIQVPVMPVTSPNCWKCNQQLPPIQDTSICKGMFLFPDVLIPNANVDLITFEAFPHKLISYSATPPTKPAFSKLFVSNIAPTKISNITAQLESICLDLNTDKTSDIQIQITSPSGQTLPLLNSSKINGSNLKKTCFSPKSNNAITSAVAPYTGTYTAEGNWSILNGSSTNGDWNLSISDKAGFYKSGELINWSISFHTDNTISYNWTPDLSGVQCKNCPSTLIKPISTTTYEVNASDPYGCNYQEKFHADVTPVYDAPQPKCGIMDNGKLTIQWTPETGPTNYLININNSGWVNTMTLSSHQINGLSNGDSVSIQLKAPDLNPICPSPATQLGCRFLDCNLYGVVENTIDVTCYGGNDGIAYISGYDGTAPFTYNLDGLFSQNTGYFNTMVAGTHTVIITDNDGCMDTVQFVLKQPDSMVVNIVIDSVKCFGGNTGGASVSVTGATPNYNYLWYTIPADFDSVITNQKAGIYFLQITDSKGCTTTRNVNIYQNTPIDVQSTSDSTRCFGSSDGALHASASGGVPGYTFSWPGGKTGKDILNVPAGTYYVTATDFNKCIKLDTVVVQTPDPFIAVADSIPVTCNGGGDGKAQAFTQYGFSPFKFSWNDPLGQTTSTASNLKAGKYTVVITDAHGCTSMDTTWVTQPDTMNIQFSSVAPNCNSSNDGSITASVNNSIGPYSYEWNDPGKQKTQTAINLGSGNFTVTVTNGKGCKQTAKYSLSSPNDIKNSFNTTQPTCNSLSDGSIMSNPSGGTFPFNYTWNVAGSGNTTTISSLPSGNYTLTITDSKGCKLIDSVNLQPGYIFAPDSFKIKTVACFSGKDGTATIYSKGGFGTIYYDWNDALKQTGQTAVGLGAGTYIVTLTDSKFCKVSDTILLTQPPVLQLNATPQHILCFGDSTGTINATTLGGTGNKTYSWLNGITWIGSQQSMLPAGNYSILATDANGCKDTTVVQLNQPATAVDVSLSQTIKACFNTKGNEAKALASGGTGPSYQYLWNTGTNPGNATQSNLNAGNYSVTVTDQNGCTTSKDIIIDSYPDIVPTLNIAPPTCAGLKNGLIQVNQVTGGSGTKFSDYTFTWNTIPAQTGPIATNLEGGKSILLQIKDPKGCISDTLIALPTSIPFNSTQWKKDAICFGTPTAEGEIQNISGGVAPYQVQWKINGVNVPGAKQTGLLAGQYQITITDGSNCDFIDTIDILQPPQLQIQFQIIPNPCAGDTKGTITTTTLGGVPNYSYQWGSGSINPNLSNLDNGQYPLTVTDNNGCTVQKTATVNSLSNLMVDEQVKQLSCVGKPDGSIKLIANQGVTPYIYSINNGPDKFSGVFNNLNSGEYILIVKDGAGCTWKDTVVLDSVTSFKISAGQDVSINQGETAQLQATIIQGNGPVDYTWKKVDDDSYSCINCDNPEVMPLQTSVYHVVGKNANGCISDDYVLVHVSKKQTIWVPTAFTPDENGNNDVLNVLGDSRHKVIRFTIFNRWGEEVYKKENFAPNDPTTGWDGNIGSLAANAGVYVWLLEVVYYDGAKETLYGQTTLIR